MSEENGRTILTDLLLQMAKNASNVPMVRMQAAIGLAVLDRSVAMITSLQEEGD